MGQFTYPLSQTLAVPVPPKSWTNKELLDLQGFGSLDCERPRNALIVGINKFPTMKHSARMIA